MWIYLILLFPSVEVIQISRLNNALCAHLIQKQLPLLLLLYWNNEARSLLIILILQSTKSSVKTFFPLCFLPPPPPPWPSESFTINWSYQLNSPPLMCEILISFNPGRCVDHVRGWCGYIAISSVLRKGENQQPILWLIGLMASARVTLWRQMSYSASIWTS